MSGDEILHVFDVRFQNVAGDIETENVDDSFVRCDDFTNFFIDETILELFSSRGVPFEAEVVEEKLILHAKCFSRLIHFSDGKLQVDC